MPGRRARSSICARSAEGVQPPQGSYNPPMDGIHLLVVVVMIAIVASLGNALFHLAKGDSSAKMGRALTVRITLSLVLFLLLMAAKWAGLIHPNQYH